jgi:hypothetical protein
MNGTMASFWVLSFLYSGAVSITTLVCVFKDSVLKGLICLLVGPYIIYWVYAESDSDSLKAAFAVHLLLWIPIFVSFATRHAHGFTN